jgi:hypothetical protein
MDRNDLFLGGALVFTRRAWMIGAVAPLLSASLRRHASAAEDDGAHVRVPSYRPPARGAPGGRIGGGSRGAQNEIPTILVLAPDHEGLSATNQPVVFWYLSQDTAGSDIKVAVGEAGGGESTVTQVLAGQIERGIHPLSFAQMGITLRADASYEWKVSYASPTDSSKTMLSRGLISYSEPKSRVKADVAKAKADDLPFVYASAGYWYDAVQALSVRITDNPGMTKYKAMRAALLDQVRLHDPADFDREALE